MDSETWSLSNEHDLWRQRFGKAKRDARVQLIEHYLQFARSIAVKLYVNRPDDQVEFEDYLQFARIGLIESVDRFEPQKDVSFTTYASYRIKGAILNGIQKFTERREQIAYQGRIRKERLEMVKSTSIKNEGDCTFKEMIDVVIELALGYLLEDIGVVRDSAQITEDSAYKTNSLQQIKQQLNKFVQDLPEREQQVIRYHYFNQVSLIELADLFDISRGRVSQIHKRALTRLKEALSTQDVLDSYY